MQLIVRFKIFDNLRYLSHLEMVSMLERALVRVGARMIYSEGFNPRPRFSLLFPRAVGVESNCDMFVVRLEDTDIEFNCDNFKKTLNNKLAFGCEIVSLEIVEDKVKYYPKQVKYCIEPGRFLLEDTEKLKELRDKIEHLLSKGNITIERKIGSSGNNKKVEIRRFIEDINLSNYEIEVKCLIDRSGTIRVDEILKLLGLSEQDLSKPVRRTELRCETNIN